MSEEFNVDYRILRHRIIKSCVQVSQGTMDFRVDYNKLLESCDELNLVPLFSGLDAHHVRSELVPFLNEYFKGENLSWFTDDMFCTAISFIRKDYIDEHVQEVLDKLRLPQTEDPTDDKVNHVAELLAKYPCYNVTIVAYKSNNPKYLKLGKPSYVVQIRANKIIIEDPSYQYNYKDFS